ncbi:hypothetical protein GmRootV35_12990 [Variovorax sp. V35]
MPQRGVDLPDLASGPVGVVRGHDRLEQTAPIPEAVVLELHWMQQVLPTRLLHPEADLGFEGILAEDSGGLAVSDTGFWELESVELAINDRRWFSPPRR